jgi:FkbM family methyltransferase
MNSDPKVIFDIGGNKGLYSKELVKIFPESEIHIFEPNSSNFLLLKDIFKNNNKVYINNNAISNDEGEITLYSDFDGSGLASLTKRRLEHFNNNMTISEKVYSKRLANYINQNNIRLIDLIKLDIEGHELDALNSLNEHIKICKIIQFEFGGANIDTKTYFQDFFYFFKEHNFSLYRITPFTLKKVNSYRETMEKFITTNYIAVNNN